MDTVWVLGDQLRRGIASLHKRRPSDTRVLVVESNRLDRSKPWHVQRAHFVKASMRRFARQLEAAGFSVDYRRSASFREGLEEHRRRYHPRSVFAMEPSTWAGRAALARLDVSLVRSNQFLCHYEDFAVWAEDRPRIRMEAFYRWQRKRLGVLMDGTRPAGGRWSFDAENREPPPKQGADWPRVVQSRLDALDDRVLSELPNHLTGDPPRGVWATSRRGALRRLDHFVEKVLPHFGPHQDAMVEGQWHLNHSLLSPYLNVGLLSPAEVVVRAERAWREGTAPLASVEGFVRQIIGWREYMWGSYWLHMPGYVLENALSAERPLPPLFHTGKTAMRCVAAAIESVRKNAYAHHIQRLMILGNLALLSGVKPRALVDWMSARFIDAAEWVMIPNVISMALYADGGRMTTKPYAAGGSYVHRMSTHCGSCRFNPKKRTGDDACPLTTLYWDFLARNRNRLANNGRLQPQLRGLDRLSDLEAVRSRAAQVLDDLDTGNL